MAKVAVEGFLGGLHRSVTHGFGMEFEQYRHYTPGEDLKYLDWKVLAKCDRLYTKVFHEETDTDCLLLIDVSASMGYQGPASPFSKLGFASLVAACLALLADRQGDHPGLYSYAEHLRDGLPPRRRAGLTTLWQHLTNLEPAGVAQHRASLEGLVARVRRRSLVVMLSDFLDAEQEAPAVLRSFAARGCDCLAIQILDPDEITLPTIDFARFIDLESGRQVATAPGLTSAGYREQFFAFQDALRAAFLAQQLPLLTLTSRDALTPALAAFLRQRQHHRRR